MRLSLYIYICIHIHISKSVFEQEATSGSRVIQDPLGTSTSLGFRSFLSKLHESSKSWTLWVVLVSCAIDSG